MEEVSVMTVYIGNAGNKVEVETDGTDLAVSCTWQNHYQGNVTIPFHQLDNLITALNAVRNVKNNNERKQT
jgi:hypothetical protein